MYASGARSEARGLLVMTTATRSWWSSSIFPGFAQQCLTNRTLDVLRLARIVGLFLSQLSRERIVPDLPLLQLGQVDFEASRDLGKSTIDAHRKGREGKATACER